MKLDFIIIGGQKCGSTYLHEVINEHPDIEMVPGECPHFESPDYEKGGVEQLNKLIEKLDNNKILGIKRPSYLSKSEVPFRIKKVNNKVKLIVILRNPLERLKSAYFHYMNYGFSPLLELNSGIEKLLNGDLAKQYPRTAEILEFSFYWKNLNHYLDIFKENILVLTYDELKEDRKSVIEKCYSFLGVNKSFIPSQSLNSRPQKVNYSLIRTRFLAKMNKHQYIYNKDRTRLFNKDKSVWDKCICGVIYLIDKYVLIFFIKNNKKPEFDSYIKQQLIKKYHLDIENLEKTLNVDLSRWKE